MKSIISAHSQQILFNGRNYGCNCSRKTDCPMQYKCLAPQVVYGVEFTNSTDEKLKIYYSLTETTFLKNRKHKTSFNNRDRIKNFELPKHVWSLKDQNKASHVKWTITLFNKITLKY